MTTLVQVEVIEDLAEEGRVTSSKLKNAGFDFTEEVRDGLLGDLGVLLLRDLPSRFHHANEVLVGWGGHAEVGVVVREFLHGYDAVRVTFGALEVAEEVGEDLIASLAALEEFWVH